MQGTTEKPAAFFYHYNKPEAKRQKRNVLSVHWRKQCFLVHAIDCHVRSYSVDRKRQPRCVMRGRGVVRVVDGKAVITAK